MNCEIVSLTRLSEENQGVGADEKHVEGTSEDDVVTPKKLSLF